MIKKIKSEKLNKTRQQACENWHQTEKYIWRTRFMIKQYFHRLGSFKNDIHFTY